MFRVPVSAEVPTFDETFKVGFGRWLTSKAAERKEWMRRRNAAAKVAQQGQSQRGQAWLDRKQAELKALEERKRR